MPAGLQNFVMASSSWDWLTARGQLFGCRICNAALTNLSNIRDAFAIYNVSKLKMSNVRRHAQSKLHLRNAASMKTGANPNAPTRDQFDKVWMSRHMGASLAAPVDGVTSGESSKSKPSRKVACMLWCLGEAKRMRFREFLKTAVSATLNQDVRQEQLIVRMTACSADLTQMSGAVGMVKTAGGATNLCLATITALEQLCTPFAHQPGPAASKPPELDKALMKHVCEIITWWYTGAASEELSAGEMLMSGTAARRLFPNLKILGREKAHASRRVLERPQKAEPFLEEVAAHFLWNKDSIGSLLEHIPVCKSVWQAASRESEDAAAIKNLRFRRHRFDSQAEPLARIVLSFDGVLRAASILSHSRKSDDAGKAASQFLQWLDDEKALQVAMLADASDQILTLTRHCDVEFPDPAEHAAFVGTLIVEGTMRWLVDKIWPVGCADHMMRALSKHAHI